MSGTDGAQETADQRRGREQTAINVARYEEVFNLCLASARRTMGDGAAIPQDATLNVAKAIFDRFQQDQLELAKQAALIGAARPLLESVARSMERRGLLV